MVTRRKNSINQKRIIAMSPAEEKGLALTSQPYGTKKESDSWQTD
jgi:hypothetical protein